MDQVVVVAASHQHQQISLHRPTPILLQTRVPHLPSNLHLGLPLIPRLHPTLHQITPTPLLPLEEPNPPHLRPDPKRHQKNPSSRTLRLRRKSQANHEGSPDCILHLRSLSGVHPRHELHRLNDHPQHPELRGEGLRQHHEEAREQRVHGDRTANTHHPQLHHKETPLAIVLHLRDTKALPTLPSDLGSDQKGNPRSLREDEGT